MPLVSHKSCINVAVIWIRLDSWTILDHWWGIALVGNLERAATPFHWPASLDWCRLATGCPLTQYLQADREHLRFWRNRCIACSERCVSDTNKRSISAKFSWITIALFGKPDGLQDATLNSRRHCSESGPGWAASPKRQHKIKSTLLGSARIPKWTGFWQRDWRGLTGCGVLFSGKQHNASPRQSTKGYRGRLKPKINMNQSVSTTANAKAQAHASTPHRQRSESSDFRLANRLRIWDICESNIAAMFCWLASVCPWICLLRLISCA